ncbi:polysaccharide pyruvyl transferase family protein [Tunturibacter psychrotolerans]|uniref:Polysaccharide pyruvyl transferase family protein n=1 Tax=Tunturiibacter psychrotolerans TaxID=3069686 RepID=A0AAU7ZNF7_9BACT
MKIGLLDHMGYGNLGDAATQEALIANIKRRLPDTEIVGFSLNPDDTRKRHDIACYSITHWHPGLAKSGLARVDDPNLWSQLKLTSKRVPIVSGMIKRALHLCREVAHLFRSYKVLRSLDTMIIAGGGQLTELWRGPWSHPYNVLKFSILTKLANRRLLFLNVGAGPLSSNLSKIFVKFAVHLADYVSLRDVESQALIRRLGVNRTTEVFPDSVYALDVSSYEATETVKPLRPLVGINPIGFCDPRVWLKRDKSAYLHYLDKLTEFSLWLIRQDYTLRIFSGELSVDVHAVEDLKERILNSLPSGNHGEMFIPPSIDLKDLLTEMSRFDFVVTSKFHGVVFSHLLEKPVIALSYHKKIDDLMRTVGHSQHCLNIESFDCEHFKKTFKSLVENAEGLKSQFRKEAYSRSELLKTQFDQLFTCRDSEFYLDALKSEKNGAVVGNST